MVVKVIAGAAAAQIVKQEMESEGRFDEQPRAEAQSRSGVRARLAAALHAAAERLEPAPRGRPDAASLRGGWR